MPGIDESIAFLPVHIAILTVSDTRGEEEDRSGPVLVERATRAGHKVVRRERSTDDQARIEQALQSFIEDPNIDVVISTGGTGVTGRDVTPEAFRAVYEKEIEGFGELFRSISLKHVGTSTIQSRATAGVAKGKYLFALPGSPGACKDAWDE
ncbi:MAG TPA: molybdenum cofactor synthesis domain-containing protein, partial [Polyangiaceae bacterium]|nr:molybdenum cofactor synthesis domain-containing protein [Polyangiaceae bacterium]